MQRRGGVDGVKNQSGQWEGPGGGGSSTGALCTGYPLVYIIWHVMETEGVQTSFLYLIKFSEKFLDTQSADRF